MSAAITVRKGTPTLGQCSGSRRCIPFAFRKIEICNLEKKGRIHTGMKEVCVESMLFGYYTLIPVHS